MFGVSFTKKAEKELMFLSLKDQKRIVKALMALAEDPFSGKKLQGRLAPAYSIRVWPYRIIYLIEKKTCLVFVIRFGHRKEVYQ